MVSFLYIYNIMIFKYTQGFLHTLLCCKNRYDFRDEYNKNDFRPSKIDIVIAFSFSGAFRIVPCAFSSLSGNIYLKKSHSNPSHLWALSQTKKNANEIVDKILNMNWFFLSNFVVKISLFFSCISSSLSSLGIWLFFTSDAITFD